MNGMWTWWKESENTYELGRAAEKKMGIHLMKKYKKEHY